MFSFEEQEKILTPLLKNPSNRSCADCGSISPNWASLDFGVFLCSNCSGAHRALGPTITRVKSTKLDLWQREWVQNMKVGNDKINEYWEGLHVEAMMKKPKNGANLHEYNKYVQDKYVRRKFIKPENNDADPLKKYKNQTYKEQKEQESMQNSEMKYIQKKMQKRGISEPVQISIKSEKVPKHTYKNDNLLDDVFEEKKQEPFIPNVTNNNETTFKSASNPPSSMSVQNDDEFTEYVSGNENLSTEQNSQISFDQLIQKPKLQTHNSQPQIVHQNQIHQNLVYTGHPNNLIQNPNYHSPYHYPQQQHPQGVNYHNYNHNGYVGYQPHYQQQQQPMVPNLQYQKSQPPQNPPQTSQPAYQNFTLK